MNLDQLQSYLPQRVIRRRIRERAIENVRKDLILHGKREQDVSQEDLEYLLADAEKEVVSRLKQSSLVAALALLGINLF